MHAIGSQITDYLIKPVNPNQILLSIKKNIDNKKLITSKLHRLTSHNLGISVHKFLKLLFDDWSEIYKRILYWELELEKSQDNSMVEVFQMQKNEANIEFGKFIKNNYLNWLKSDSVNKPLYRPMFFEVSYFRSSKNRKDRFYSDR